MHLAVSTTLGNDNEASVSLWHTKTLSFQGPNTSELATPNPFTDYRLLVTFRHPEVTYVVRGFYAADGDAADTGASSGGVWKVRFIPDRIGRWSYSASFKHGKDLAIRDEMDAGTPIEISNPTGVFIATKNSSPNASRDFRRRGRIIADGAYLRFGKNGPFWLKGGTDSPENLLAFADFDGTSRISVEVSEGEATATEELHRYEPHIRDWNEGDPQWKNGKGKGVIGALNYLSSTGMNCAYFLTLNIGGDGKDVWPYVSADEWTRFDCSKLDQWEIVFEHMQRRGILMHVVTQETENERMLDDGNTERLRKLYYRELIARFAHHPAIIWNLGEENGPADFSPNGQTADQQKAMAGYLKNSDPYKHPVVIHTHASKHGKDEILPALLGHEPLDGLSFQVNQPKNVHSEIIRWRNKSDQAGRTWLIGMDEIGPWHTGAVPDSVDPDHDTLRRHVLWGGLLAGASGVEWYFGAKFRHNDLTSEDWRQRDNLWKQTSIALTFFEDLRFWEMNPDNSIVSSQEIYCFAKPGSTYVLYVPASELKHENITVKLEDRDREYSVRWYDPIHGGKLQRGSVSVVESAKSAAIGKPPHTREQDWVVLIR